MNKVQCPEGHFYDSDMFSVCPMCEKMENISKSMNSKKPKFGKKSKEEITEKSEPVLSPKKQNGGVSHKRNAPSQGNIVTVAVFPSDGKSTEKEVDSGNSGILDENGYLILKAENKPKKKQFQESDYITAAEVADINNKAEPEPEPTTEPITEPEPIIVMEENVEESTSFPKEKIIASEEPTTEDFIQDEHTEQKSETEESVSEKFSEEPAQDESEQRIKSEAVQNNISPVIPTEYKVPDGGPKTVGFYHFDIEPVVGWLVCVTGQIKGKSFKLKSGQNVIGDSGIMDVYLPSKENRKGEAQAVLIFEPIKKEFIFRITGTAKCSVNDEKVESYVVLKQYDKIKIGEYQLIFKALCSDKFDWKDYE